VNDVDDAPRLTEGQLENTANFIRLYEKESRFFGGVAVAPDGSGIRVTCNGDPTDAWKERVSHRAGCVPVTFVQSKPEAEPHPPSYSDEDLELAKQVIREHYRHEFTPGGCFVGIGKQPGNRGIEIFLARQSGQHSPSHLQSMLGGIPVKLTVAGMLPPRPWSPPGFAEAYAEARKWGSVNVTQLLEATFGKPKAKAKVLPAEQAAAAINKALYVDEPDGFCAGVTLSGAATIIVHCRRQPTAAEREKCHAMAPGVLVTFVLKDGTLSEQAQPGTTTGFTTGEPIPVSPSIDEVIEKGTGAEEAQKLLPPSRPKEELKQEAVVAVADEIRSRCTTDRPPWYQATIVRNGHVELLCNEDVPAPVRARIRAFNPEVPVVFTTVGPIKMQ
jgi:hypothetical protein